MNYLLLETNKVLCFDMMQESLAWCKQLYLDNGLLSLQFAYRCKTLGTLTWNYSRSAYFNEEGYKGLVSIYDMHSEIWKYYS